jgi:hypothetical protein
MGDSVRGKLNDFLFGSLIVKIYPESTSLLTTSIRPPQTIVRLIGQLIKNEFGIAQKRIWIRVLE